MRFSRNSQLVAAWIATDLAHVLCSPDGLPCAPAISPQMFALIQKTQKLLGTELLTLTTPADAAANAQQAVTKAGGAAVRLPVMFCFAVEIASRALLRCSASQTKPATCAVGCCNRLTKAPLAGRGHARGLLRVRADVPGAVQLRVPVQLQPRHLLCVPTNPDPLPPAPPAQRRTRAPAVRPAVKLEA